MGKQVGVNSGNGAGFEVRRPVDASAERVMPSTKASIDRPSGRTSYAAGCKKASTDAK